MKFSFCNHPNHYEIHSMHGHERSLRNIDQVSNCSPSAKEILCFDTFRIEHSYGKIPSPSRTRYVALHILRFLLSIYFAKHIHLREPNLE